MPAEPSRTEALATTEPEHDGKFHVFLDAAKKFKIIGADKKEYGPITGSKIMEWIGDQRIDWKTPAQIEGTSAWQPLLAFAQKALHRPPPLSPATKLATQKQKPDHK